jgi:hypothetical protein
VLLPLLDAVIRAGCQVTWHQSIYRLSGRFGKARIGIPLACLIVVSLQIHRISLFVCFSPGIAAQFYIDEVKVGLTFAARVLFDSDALLV